MEKQLPLGVRLRDTSVFASYFPGRNRSVVDALQALSARRRGRATVRRASGCTVRSPSARRTCCRQCVPALTAFAERRVSAARGSCAARRRNSSGYGQFSLVCLDDAETVAGNANWERALFRLHRELDEQGARLVLAAPAPPAALPFKLADLASRLNGGVVLTLQPLDEQEQLAGAAVACATTRL